MPPVTRSRKREWSVLRRTRWGVRVRQFGRHWYADGCDFSAPTAHAAAWLHEFLNS